MQYYLSNNNGRLTIAISKYTAIRLILMRSFPSNMEFGEVLYVEDENETIHYKKAWFEDRPSKVLPYTPNDEVKAS